MKKHLVKFIVLMLAIMASVANVSAGTRWVYLSLKESRGSYWESAGARFALYAYTCASSSGCGTSEWYNLDLIDSGDNRVYAAEIDDKYKGVIFCRMNGSTSENNWENKWSQTGDCELPTGDNAKNCLYLIKWDEGSYWAYYWDPNTVVYVDVTNLNMTYGNWGSNVWFRVGHGSANSAWKVNNSSVNKVNGTKSLYKMSSGAGWLNYTKFYLANNCGDQSSGKGIDYESSKGSGVYLITQQAEAISSRSTTSRAYTIIPSDPSSTGATPGYTGGDKCYYYQREEYNYRKTYTITNTSVSNAEVELYYWDESNVMQTVAEGSSVEVLPTTKVWCKVTPDAGYALSHVNLHDPGQREWTDASREDGDFERNCYVVRTNVRFEAVIEPYETKTILVNDVNDGWAPLMYFKGWNPFLYEDYNNANYHYTTQKVGDKITLCGKDYYVVTISNEFPFYYIHNENDASRTAFFATNKLTHMAKYDDYTSGDGNWGLRTAPCADMVYWVETYKGTGPKYISNIVSNTTDTMSFYVESGGTVDFHAGSNDPVNQYSTVFAKYFDSGKELDGKAGGVFTATSNAGGTGLTNDTIFDGDYHIHVNAKTRNYLDPGGVSREGTTGTKFTKFDKSRLFGDTYSYYWVDWFLGGGDGGYYAQSVVATVGNKYNVNLAGVLGSDAYAQKGETSSSGGNVRYGYDPETNFFERAIVGAAGGSIKIAGLAETDSVQVWDGDSYENATPSDQQSFNDATYWNYKVSAQVKGGAHANVTTSYNGGSQTLANKKKLIQGIDGNLYTVEVTYDFKTNRLIAVWVPGEDAFIGFSLESNLMIERVEDGAGHVLNISEGELLNVTQIYTVMTFTKDHWKDAERTTSGGGYTDAYYWISLPYDCKISDIFGIEGYGNYWVIQTYHGDYRAEKGWWAEIDSWWYNMGRDGVMKKHQGYVIRLTNLDTGSGPFTKDGVTTLRLYFPSADTDLKLGRIGSTTTTTVPEHICTKVRDEANHAGDPNYDRRVIDSNWNIIGSPSFNSAEITDGTWQTTIPDPEDPGDAYKPANPALKYFYTWEIADSKVKYTAVDAKNRPFPSTHAYLVQYAGTINWAPDNDDATDPLVAIKTSAPKRDRENIGDQTFKLTLNKDSQQVDVTYISRMAEGATADYDLNMDLSKLMNKNGNNLYTLVGYYKMAGNCLPDSINSVPVGLRLAQDGEYTFSMPEGTNGTGVILIDNIAGTRTNLALTDYTVNLTAGTYDTRFSLEITPIADVPSDIEQSVVETCGARKVMVDGIMYIVKDGKAFDARGNRVQ